MSNIYSITECPSIQEEEYILNTIDKNQKFDYVHQAFGYVSDKGEYMLVAAILKKKDEDEYYLAGATGINYGNTNELQVMNYDKDMATVHREEWVKAIKLGHKKMVN